MPFFNNNPPRQFLRDKIFFKNYPGEILIEQIIDFELRGPGSPGCNIPTTGYFYETAKIF